GSASCRYRELDRAGIPAACRGSRLSAPLADLVPDQTAGRCTCRGAERVAVADGRAANCTGAGAEQRALLGARHVVVGCATGRADCESSNRYPVLDVHWSLLHHNKSEDDAPCHATRLPAYGWPNEPRASGTNDTAFRTTERAIPRPRAHCTRITV